MGLLHRLAGGVAAVAHERLKLAALELHEEKFRVVQTFIWISAAVFAAMMALAFASLTLVYLFDEDNRLIALGALAGFYSLVLVVISIAFRRFLARQPQPFAATVEELAKDSACIQPEM